MGLAIKLSSVISVSSVAIGFALICGYIPDFVTGVMEAI